MRQERKEILTSAGNLGIEPRTYNRLYWNWEQEPVSTSGQLTSNIRQLIMRAESEGKTRVVFKGLVSQPVVEGLTREPNGIVRNLEVALPISNGEEWFFMFGRNSPQRKSLVPIDEIVKETSLYERDPQPISERLAKLLSQGYVLRDSFDREEAEQVFSLWGKTFEWTFDQVMNLSSILMKEQGLPAGERSAWFSGVEHDGLFVSISTAERLRLKTQNGHQDIVESTEWKTREGFENRGLLTSAITYLNAQILHALPECLIVAECNFKSRSDRAAHGAGFIVPERQVGNIVVPQILVQNVAVYDGYEPVGLRDFTFMYVPRDNRERFYQSSETSRIMNLAKRGAI